MCYNYFSKQSNFLIGVTLKKLFIFLILLTFLTNCEYFNTLSQKEWEEKSDHDADDVIIYASGAQYDSTAGNYLPCYWKIEKDGFKKIDLESKKNVGVSQSIFVDGDTVYNCGFDDPGGLYRACYWINQKKTDLNVTDPLVYSSLAYQIILKDGIIFTVGTEQNGGGDQNAITWVFNEMSTLHNHPPNTSAECIFVQQQSSSFHSIYIGGMYSGNPCYWKNDQIIYLDDHETNNIMVRSMSVIGNTVYSCGQKSDPLPEVACFWKNKELSYLSEGTDANSIFISGGNVYIAGIYENTGIIYACYWKNGKKYYLEDSYFAGGDSIANSIFILNDNIYIGGRDDDGSGSNGVSWYYINGKKRILDTSVNAGIISIFVKKK
jgi:hypothetical protein